MRCSLSVGVDAAGGVEMLEGLRVALLDVRDARGNVLVLGGSIAHPDVERRSPPALARQCPIDVIGEKVAEASFFDVGRQPVDRATVRDRPVDDRGRADVPGGPRILDERIAVGAPAEWVIVPVGLRVDEQARVFEVVLDFLVAVPDPPALIALEALDERTVRLDRAHQIERRRTVARRESPLLLDEQAMVVFAERRRDMDDPRARVERDEVADDDPPIGRLRVRTGVGTKACLRGSEEIERRRVLPALEILPSQLALDLERADLLLEGFAQALGDDEALAALGANDDVLERTMHGRVHIGRERPRGRRPDEERQIDLPDDGERDIDAGIVDGLVTKPHLAGAERGAALRPPPNDLVPLVEEALLVELTERPPGALHVGPVVGHVRVAEVAPERDALGQLLPFARIPKDRFEALLHERFDAVRLDRRLAVDAELLLDLDLDGEAVRIPAGFARDAPTAHRLIPGE